MGMLSRVRWPDLDNRPTNPVDYVCGWCDRNVTSYVGSYAKYDSTDEVAGFVRMCPSCGRASWLCSWEPQAPGPKYGDAVSDLPENLGALYGEARDCVAIGAYHAVVMVSRKILMHVAVEKGAKEGESFAAYVNYLSDNNLVPPDSKDWVDEIREIGNDANHEIFDITQDEAKGALDFVSMLLKLVYEYPERGRRSVAARTSKEMPA